MSPRKIRVRACPKKDVLKWLRKFLMNPGLGAEISSSYTLHSAGVLCFWAGGPLPPSIGEGSVPCRNPRCAFLLSRKWVISHERHCDFAYAFG